MKGLKSVLLRSFTTLFTVSLVISSAQQAQAQKPVTPTVPIPTTQPVVVRNTAAQAVPVTVTSTPNVNVVNTPSVSVANVPNVNVTNTPTVNVASMPPVALSGTPAVSIANTNANPVAVTVRPTHFQVFLQWLNNGTLGTSCYTVTNGNRFIVEYANVHVILGDWIRTDGNLLPEALLFLYDEKANELGMLELGPLGRVVQDNNRFFGGSLPMKLAVEPGQQLCISNNSGVSASAWVFLAGYLEPSQ